MENKFNDIPTNKESKEERENPLRYRFGLIDTRPIPVAKEKNNEIFESGKPVVGVELTIPEYADRCVRNIDPQHTGGNANVAAIEEAVTSDLPDPDSVFVTVRPDLDSVGAMAVFLIRSEDGSLDDDAMERIRIIADIDKFVKESYPGPRPFPSKEKLWNNRSEEMTAAIAVQISDFKVPLSDRVLAMKEWIKTGKESEEYRTRAINGKLDMLKALDSGDVHYELKAGGRVAFVESTYPGAVREIGYSLAPVVVALNPSFSARGEEPHKKFTIGIYKEGEFLDLPAVFAELRELEPKWGGSPTIGGSPQGESSKLTVDQVISIVEKHLKED